MPSLRPILIALSALLLCGCGDKPQTAGTAGGGVAAAPTTRFMSIGTGGLTGVYYPVGGAIAKMVNAKKSEYGLRLSVESTNGSVYNVNALLAGEIEFGVVQSDLQYDAIKGQGAWEETGPRESLRAVMSMHPEMVTLVAAVDADIDKLADLEGKRVNIGDLGSGNRQNALQALALVGLDPDVDLRAESVKASEAAGLLQDERLDAYFYTVGHPNGSVKEATSGTRKVQFVPIIEGVDELIAEHPYFAKARIPLSAYPNAANREDVPTFGVKATLMTTADVPDEVVYAVVKEVVENFDSFKGLHPSLGDLEPKDLLQGLSAPLHPGAAKAFRERGLLE